MDSTHFFNRVLKKTFVAESNWGMVSGRILIVGYSMRNDNVWERRRLDAHTRQRGLSRH